MALPEQLQHNHGENVFLPEDSQSILNAWEFRQKSESLVEDALSRGSEVVLSAHKGPDDDAIYSLKAYLEILKHRYPDGKFRVVMSNRKVEKYNALFEPGEIVWAEEMQETTSGASRKADLVDYLNSDSLLIFMDAAQYSRVSNIPEAIQQMANGHPDFSDLRLQVAIPDHHTGQADVNDAELIDPEKTSTCELIYLMYRNTDLSPTVCQHLLRGLFSDTRFLRFVNSANPHVLQYVGELLHRSGLPNLNVMYREMYRKSKGTVAYERQLTQNSVTKADIADVLGYPIPAEFPEFWYGFISPEERAIIQARGIGLDGSDQMEANRNMAQEALVNGADISWTVGGGAQGVYYIGFRAEAMASLVPLTATLFEGGGHGMATGGKFIATQDEQQEIEVARQAEGEAFNESSYVSQLILRRLVQHTEWARDERGRWQYRLVSIAEKKPSTQHKEGVPNADVFQGKTEKVIAGLIALEVSQEEIQTIRDQLAVDPFKAYLMAERKRILLTKN